MGMNRIVAVRLGLDLIDLASATLGLQELRDGPGAEEAAKRGVGIGSTQHERAIAVAGRHRLGLALLGWVSWGRVVGAGHFVPDFGDLVTAAGAACQRACLRRSSIMGGGSPRSSRRLQQPLDILRVDQVPALWLDDLRRGQGAVSDQLPDASLGESKPLGYLGNGENLIGH